MEQTITNFSTIPNQEQGPIVKEFKKGRFPVYLIHKNGKPFIIKAFPYIEDKISPNYLNEARFSFLSHPNIVSINGCYEEANFDFDCLGQRSSCIQMEYAPNGDFFDLCITRRICMSDKLARTYFHQLIDALEYLHLNGVAHLDLKLHNLLLGAEYELKITDFDLSHMQGDGKLISRGSKYYRAPELNVGCCIDPPSADIFAAGILLFVFKSRGVLPHTENQSYKGIDLYGLMRNDNDKFWEVHAEIQKKPSEFFSKEFRELFNSMTKTKAHERASIQDIKNSAWFNGPTYTKQELKEVMEKKLMGKNSFDLQPSNS